MHGDGAHRVNRGLHIENLVEQDGVFIDLAAFDFDEALAYWFDKSNALGDATYCRKEGETCGGLTVIHPSRCDEDTFGRLVTRRS